jgi:O-antigen/teichoic acid export membrane protein
MFFARVNRVTPGMHFLSNVSMPQAGLLESDADERSVAAAIEGLPPRPRHVPNAVSAVVLFGARLLAAIFQLRLVDKYWGGGYTGLNALSNQVLLYVTLLELGLSQSATTFLYEPILKRNFPRASGIVLALRHDVRVLSIVGSAVVFPAVAWYAHTIHGALPLGIVTGTLTCIAVTGLLQLTAIHLQVYLNAAEQLDKVNYTFAAGYLLKTAIGLPLAIYWHNYLLLPIAIAVLTLGELISLRIAFQRSFPQFHPVPWRDEARQIRKRASFVIIQRVAGVAYYQSDFIILSITTSLVMVKDYAKFQYVAAALLSIVGLVASSLTTSVARLRMRQHAENRRRQYVTAQSAICLIGVVLMVAFWFSADSVVSLVFGNDTAIEKSAILLLGVALALNIVKVLDDIFIMAKGAFEIGYWIPAVEVPVYVLTGVVLTRRLGLEGILIASIATNIVVSIGLKGIVLSRPVFDSTKLQWYGNRFLSIAKALLAVLPLVCLYELAQHFLHPTFLRFGVTSLAALGYMVAGVHWLLSRRLRQERSA